jgi:hypothetical protein
MAKAAMTKPATGSSQPAPVKQADTGQVEMLGSTGFNSP